MTIANVNVRQILIKRGNTTVSSSYVGPLGEITLDTGLNTVRVHDGETPGGSTILATSTDIQDVNASISNLQNTIDSITGFDSSLLANAATQQEQINNILDGTSLFHSVIPTEPGTFRLGTDGNEWQSVYLTESVVINGIPLTVDGDGNLLVNGTAIVSGGGGVTSYNDLTDLPTLVTSYNDLTDLPTLVTSYTQLTDLPTIPTSILDLGITDSVGGDVLTTNGDGTFSFSSIPTPTALSNSGYNATLYANGTLAVPGPISSSLNAGDTNIDTSGTLTTLADGASVSWSNFSGMIMVNDHLDGGVFVWLVGGGGVAPLGNTLAPSGAMTYDNVENMYVFTNTSGDTRNFAFATIKTRNSA